MEPRLRDEPYYTGARTVASKILTPICQRRHVTGQLEDGMWSPLMAHEVS
jgi:hypothetical protein